MAVAGWSSRSMLDRLHRRQASERAAAEAANSRGLGEIRAGARNPPTGTPTGRDVHAAPGGITLKCPDGHDLVRPSDEPDMAIRSRSLMSSQDFKDGD